MKKWEDFESEMTLYLKQTLEKYDVLVKQYGSADSTIPDIEITINKNNKKFYVETKMPASQTSQFVVEIKNKKFVYGSKNKFDSNDYSEQIIEILNDNFDLYSKVTQNGMVVPVPETIAFGWITSNMKNKNVEFITSIDSKGNKKVFSLKQFKDFFNVKTIFRRKKSGSQDLPSAYFDIFSKCIKSKYEKYNYKLYKKRKKTYLELPMDLSKNDCYIDNDLLPEGKRFFLSNKGDGKYEAKLTSATNNQNIIFELSLRENNDSDMFTIQCLIDYINNNM